MADYQFSQPAEVFGGFPGQQGKPVGPLRFGQPDDAADSRVIHQHKEET
jgi:hypothetical protein